MEHTARKIFTNTMGQAVLRFIEVLLGVVTLGLITRYLGQSGFGQYTTINAILQLFIVIIDFGLYLTLLREISANPVERTEYITNNIFTMRLMSSAALLLLAIVSISFTPYPAEIKWGVLSLSFAYLSVSLTATLTALFQKYLQMVKVAALNAGTKVLMLGMVSVVIWLHGGLQSILVGSSIVAAIAFGILWYLVRRLPGNLHLRIHIDLPYWREIISKAWPIAATTALNLIYFKADTIVLSMFRGPEEVGLYGAGYRVLEIMVSFPHMFMGLVLPVLTAAWIARDGSRVDRIWQRAFLFFTLMTFPLMTGALILGVPVMKLIAGSEFAESGNVLKVLVLATAAIFFGTLGNYIVLVLEQQRKLIKFFLLNAALSLAGYLIFIPKYSYWGAAWITVGSECFIVLAAWIVIRPHLKLTVPWGATAKIALASVFMAVFAYFAQSALPLIPLLIVCATLYGALLLAFRAVSFSELKSMIRP
ncbi:MAG: flippase [Candidatus Komeilibacteria bacterium]|nr:flippase [Candidatus Komeilibacteria bacterium]